MLKLRARKLSRCRLFPLGALTRGLKGETLTEMAELHEAGCVGYSQAEVAIKDTQVLQRAMQYASPSATRCGCVRKMPGWVKVWRQAGLWPRLGLSGVPVSAKTIAIHTIVELVRATGARVHLCRIWVQPVLNWFARPRPEAPHHRGCRHQLADADRYERGYFSPAMRLTPPLRQGRDRDA